MHSSEELALPLEAPDSTTVQDEAGGVVGILNTAIVIPQFVMIGVSSAIFSIFDPNRGVINGKFDNEEKGGVDAVGLVFRIAGLAAFGAFYLTLRLRSHLQRQRS